MTRPVGNELERQGSTGSVPMEPPAGATSPSHPRGKRGWPLVMLIFALLHLLAVAGFLLLTNVAVRTPR